MARLGALVQLYCTVRGVSTSISRLVPVQLGTSSFGERAALPLALDRRTLQDGRCAFGASSPVSLLLSTLAGRLGRLQIDPPAVRLWAAWFAAGMPLTCAKTTTAGSERQETGRIPAATGE
jgi:hypothetical protein